MIVGEQGTGYEEVLKKVKENITVTDTGRAIKYIRSTKQGVVLIATEKNDVAFSKIREGLEKNGGVIRLISNNSNREAQIVVTMKGMDALAFKNFHGGKRTRKYFTDGRTTT